MVLVFRCWLGLERIFCVEEVYFSFVQWLAISGLSGVGVLIKVINKC